MGFSDQHRRTDVEFLFELSDEDVDGDDGTRVFVLHLTYDVRHPFEVTLGSRHPNEIHLVTEKQVDVISDA